jgi:predicted transcriptional regulator
MNANDVMASPVISVEPDATVLQDVRIMLQRRVFGPAEEARLANAS